MLHITNGDAARLAQAGVDGEIIVWRDLLHDGPVTAGLNLEAWSCMRAGFIHTLVPGLGIERVMSDFQTRDRALMKRGAHGRVFL